MYRCRGISHPVRVCPNSLNETIDRQVAIAYLQLPRPPPARGAASRWRNGTGRGAGRETTPTRAPPTRAAPRTSAAHFANEPDDHDDAEPITEESAHSTWVGAGFEILGPDDAAFSGSGYAFACSDSFDSAAAYLPALDNLELDTAFIKPLERTVTPATTNGQHQRPQRLPRRRRVPRRCSRGRYCHRLHRRLLGISQRARLAHRRMCDIPGSSCSRHDLLVPPTRLVLP